MSLCLSQAKNSAGAARLKVRRREALMRMVKYTGYGNAAGFLARRGALLGGNGNSDLSSGAQYSSDSEDSDIEEYKQFKA
ncbi:hypothetical protein Cfor_07314, partial [Coptotermes formosanus]